MTPTSEQLVDEHLDAMYDYARLRLRQEDLARDLVQRTFLRAFQRLSQLRQPDSARAWLISILRNEIAQEYRAHARFECWEAEDFEALPEETGDDDGIDPALLQALPQALERLSDGARNLLLLRFQQDLSYGDISELLQIPLGTVQSRLNRAKAGLKAQLVALGLDLKGGVP